jgi:hypothetical protein
MVCEPSLAKRMAADPAMAAIHPEPATTLAVELDRVFSSSEGFRTTIEMRSKRPKTAA